MANYPSFGITSSDTKYEMAIRHGAAVKGIVGSLGDAVGKGIMALNDEKVKKRLIDEMTTRWPDLKAKEADMMDMDAKTLSGKAFVMSNVDAYLKAKKAEHPDQQAMFPSPATYFDADSSHLELIKKNIDGMDESAKTVYIRDLEKKAGTAISGAKTAGQAVQAGVGETGSTEMFSGKGAETSLGAMEKQEKLDAQQKDASGRHELQKERLGLDKHKQFMKDAQHGHITPQFAAKAFNDANNMLIRVEAAGDDVDPLVLKRAKQAKSLWSKILAAHHNGVDMDKTFKTELMKTPEWQADIAEESPDNNPAVEAAPAPPQLIKGKKYDLGDGRKGSYNDGDPGDENSWTIIQ